MINLISVKISMVQKVGKFKTTEQIELFLRDNMVGKEALLVTGGSGFLGQQIVKQLLEKGYNVLATVHKKDVDVLTKHRNLNYLRVNLTKGKDLSKLDRYDFSAVFHTAAKIDFGLSPKVLMECLDTNCLATAKLLEYCRTNDVNKIIYSSTISIYSPQSAFPIKEDSQTNPTTYYGISKLCGEMVCECYKKLYGIDTTILRYTGIYGNNASAKNVVNVFLENIRAKKPLVVMGGEDVRNYIYVKDAALANVVSYEKKLGGSFNIGSHEELSVMDIALTMKKVFEEYKPVVKVVKGKVPKTKIVADISKFRKHCPSFPKFSFLQAMKDVKEEWG